MNWGQQPPAQKPLCSGSTDSLQGTKQGSYRPFRLLEKTRVSEALEMDGVASSLGHRQERGRKRRAELVYGQDPGTVEARVRF